MDRESQIKAIEKTFEDNKKLIERHYSKPNVVPVEVLPIYPDFKVLLQQCVNVNINTSYIAASISVVLLIYCVKFQLWKYPCAQVIFDSDPAPTGRSVPAQIEEMSQAMIR